MYALLVYIETKMEMDFTYHKYWPASEMPWQHQQ